ncbi:MAG: DUF4062 domain-containing protein [Verrucomicrobiota bacterium]
MSKQREDGNMHMPETFDGVMISSTFRDLEEHRAWMMEALRKQKLVPVGMEDYVPSPEDDIISSSLDMVGEGAAYIGLISHRYGQIPACKERNRNRWSITRLEFEEAKNLGRPILIFVMGENHPVKKCDVEKDEKNIKKLNTFRRLASKGRIYVEFDSLEEFKEKAIHAISRLRQFLDEAPVSPPEGREEPISVADESSANNNSVPKPPLIYAEPPYLGSHEFVGRQAELDKLNDWASPSETHPMFLFEAIGGTGKSMLTWTWVNRQALEVRDDWAGRFWYSFYEKGASLSSFCQYALAYMTEQPVENFHKKKTAELAEQILNELKAKPWLLVLDGLERILVTYNRSDAAELSDEAAENPEDKVAGRDPLAAIRPEDDELLKTLSDARPSKLLLTSRLIPRALLNPANSAIPGVLHERLPGLRPADAEALLRSGSCGNISGDSGRIRSFLQEHCGCHPLVIGVLAGLINQPAPWRGDFDAWENAPDGGGQLNLADLDLIQKRNHILKSALALLPEKSRALLSTLALLSEAADAELLGVFNPHAEEADAGQLLRDTAADLEARGFLQYDGAQKHYDLHPVVRGIVAGGLRPEETEAYGERVVDHFSSQAHDPWDEAETLDDVRDGLQVVRTLLRMGRRQAAYDAYLGDLARALLFNLEAHAEILALLADFFPEGWDRLPEGLRTGNGSYLANSAAAALNGIGQYDASLAAYGAALRDYLERENWTALRALLSNIANSLLAQNRFAAEHRLRRLTLDLAEQHDSKEDLFRARYVLFTSLTNLGQWGAAEALWKELDPMGRRWSRAAYRPGGAENWYAEFRFRRGDLTEEILENAERLSSAGKNRWSVRDLHSLRGKWHLERGEPELAAKSFEEAVRMARESGLDREALDSETWLALARVRAGRLAGVDARGEAERLAEAGGSDRPLALLWLELGDEDDNDDEFREAAKRHALAAYKSAWADGEPYVRRYELDQAKAILDQLGEPSPELPDYDPANDEEFDWEPDVRAAIGKLKAEKKAREKKKAEEDGSED